MYTIGVIFKKRLMTLKRLSVKHLVNNIYIIFQVILILHPCVQI